MERSFTTTGFNKRIFFLGLLLAIFLNFTLLYLYGYSLSSFGKLEIKQQNQPKVKFIEIKEVKKPLKKIRSSKNKRKKHISKPVDKQKATGKKVQAKPVLPVQTPIIPESVQLSEKEVSLPEEKPQSGSIASYEPKIGKELEFKPVLKGDFNLSFGTRLNKFDETAFGPASGRLIVYKPPPPTIKTTLPPPPKVKVKLWINPDGTVDKVEIIYPQALGNLKLKEIIENYVLSWKFNPISSNKKQWAVTTILFKPKK